MAKLADPEKRRLANDKNLKTQSHEQILTWLYQNVAGLIGERNGWQKLYLDQVITDAHKSALSVLAAARSGLENFGRKKRNHSSPSIPHHEQELGWIKKQINFYQKYENNLELFKKDLGIPPSFPGVAVTQKKLQSPIFSKNSKKAGYSNNIRKIIGFMDLEAEVLYPTLEIDGINKGFRTDTSKWTAPKFEFFTAFNNSAAWYFDVRTNVDNLGSVMREVELLKEALSDEYGGFYGTYAIVAPHTELSVEILRCQNVETINYDPAIKFEQSLKIIDILENPRLKDDYERLHFPSFNLDNEIEDEQDYLETAKLSARYNFTK